MKYELMFQWGIEGSYDTVVIEGDSIEDIRRDAELYFNVRGIDTDTCILGSRRLSPQEENDE